ncbi:uncharacterized protein LOC142339634 [Convolutriloba macropyga]|uniref:uncharacterized protein LOC142339634 n=1 Tax=Convolutriloba macropyga TaxID=536237 RepID=UPI003F522E99
MKLIISLIVLTIVLSCVEGHLQREFNRRRPWNEVRQQNSDEPTLMELLLKLFELQEEKDELDAECDSMDFGSGDWDPEDFDLRETPENNIKRKIMVEMRDLRPQTTLAERRKKGEMPSRNEIEDKIQDLEFIISYMRYSCF